MASLVNIYFNQNQSTVEQTLFNGLKKESIQILGRTYYYLPRNLQRKDLILGEDVVSSFDLAIPVEMYMEQATGFEGDKEMFSKFGLQVSNTYTLVISKDRWEEEVQTQFDGISPNGEATFTRENNFRPNEGDLVYDPLTKFLMEIKFTDHDADFYQVGKNYLYHLSCEAFQYGSETIDTDIPDIDIFGEKSQDTLVNQLLTEAGEIIILADDEYVVREETPDKPTYGTDFVAPTTGKISIANPFE